MRLTLNQEELDYLSTGLTMWLGCSSHADDDLDPDYQFVRRLRDKIDKHREENK